MHQKKQMIAKWQSAEYTQAELARRFGVSHTMIGLEAMAAGAGPTSASVFLAYSAPSHGKSGLTQALKDVI